MKSSEITAKAKNRIVATIIYESLSLSNEEAEDLLESLYLLLRKIKGYSMLTSPKEAIRKIEQALQETNFDEKKEA